MSILNKIFDSLTTLYKALFNKKKKNPKAELLESFIPKVDVPEVLKESLIKPTVCEGCFSIYQAKHQHFVRERDIAYIDGRVKLHTVCPICGWHNKVEFEEKTQDD